MKGAMGWNQLLIETGLAKGALSMNLRAMQKEKEVVYETKGRSRHKKLYRLSDQGLVRASVTAISKGVTGQIANLLEKMSQTNPSGIKAWVRGRKGLDLEIQDPGLGKVRLTLHRSKQTE